MIRETFFNRYKGWGTITKPAGEIIMIQRSAGHVLSPSRDLLNDWQNRKKNKMTWQDYTRRFLQEMESQAAQEEIKRLAALSHTQDIWLICSCFNGRQECHRFIVLDLIRQAGGLTAW